MKISLNPQRATPAVAPFVTLHRGNCGVMTNLFPTATQRGSHLSGSHARSGKHPSKKGKSPTTGLVLFGKSMIQRSRTVILRQTCGENCVCVAVCLSDGDRSMTKTKPGPTRSMCVAGSFVAWRPPTDILFGTWFLELLSVSDRSVKFFRVCLSCAMMIEMCPSTACSRTRYREGYQEKMAPNSMSASCERAIVSETSLRRPDG